MLVIVYNPSNNNIKAIFSLLCTVYTLSIVLIYLGVVQYTSVKNIEFCDHLQSLTGLLLVYSILLYKYS